MPDVLIVGAGPVGLTAAIAARQAGLDVEVVEAAAPDRSRPGSRAIYYFPPTLRSWERLYPGLGRAIADAGTRVDRVSCHRSDRTLFDVRVSSWLSGAALPQHDVERLLRQALDELGVPIRWESPVWWTRSDPQGVELELRSGETLRAPYLIGADGARSVVRDSLGIALRGDRAATEFVMADVAAHPETALPRRGVRFWYDHPVARRNIVQMGYGSGVRVAVQCTTAEDVERLSSPAGIRECVSTVLDPWHGEHVEWVARHRFQQVVAESYTDAHRRVLLAGEAAHLFAPWGGRGINSGLMDGSESAQAIAGALREPERRVEIIDRCAARRRTWGLHNRELSGRGLQQMRAPLPMLPRRRAGVWNWY
ncbi:FAD-dependent monooxygenase [Pseudonocardiaceae bacterium YIM PH 21723]|nr:FAD-dependent monooxygenase [Pseudonocardiaceae bacterium YIM PH 21723]